MVIDEPNQNPRKLYPLVSIAALIGLFIFCMFLGQLVAWTFIKLVYHYSTEALQDLTVHPERYPNSRMALLLNHGIGTALFAFILSGLLWKKIVEKSTFSSFFSFSTENTLFLIGIGISVTILSNPLNSIFISLNKNMVLPSGFETLEASMKAMEVSTEVLIKYLTDFQNTQEILMAVLVMGAFTGIGEELFFRGALQTKLLQWTRNPHIAIWTAAAIFSFVHMQFYGFLPRMLLAVLFGYLYYWSGNLWVPIVAHACNNAFTILALHFTKNMEETKKLVESEEVMPIPAVIFSAVITAGLLYLFWKNTSPADRELPQEPIR